MSWTAVAFYTSEYAQYVASWTSMIRALGGTPVIVHRESTGDWARNTGLKPQAILQAFAQVTDPWFLYLDIDVSIEVPPSAPAGAWDVGVTRNLVMTHKNRVSAATLLFNKTPGAKRFLEGWAARCRARPGKDHDHLTHTIGVFRGVSRRERVVDVDGRIVWTPNGLRDTQCGEAPVSSAVILYKYPSRGRPDRFFRSLDSIWDNSADKENLHVACTLDEDDPLMNTEAVRARIETYPNTSMHWGRSESKIHAVNRDMPDVPWDIVVNMSDDMVFTRKGFDTCIRNEMVRTFPANDGLLHFPDQDAGARLATLYIAGRAFYERFGYIYHPGFKSLWCDNLVQDIAQLLGKYKLVDYDINVHLNPAYGHCPKDAMFVAQQRDWDHDKTLYLKIKANGYELP